MSALDKKKKKAKETKYIFMREKILLKEEVYGIY